MTEVIDGLDEVVDRFDAVVLDQWGVLHDGTTPYPGAIAAIDALRSSGKRLAILSNSGKRAAPNVDRITAMGFPADAFEIVMTSGEALWQDIAAGRVASRVLCPITRASGDAAAWAEGLDVALTDNVAQADAILLMGLPDGAVPDQFQALLDQARQRHIPVLCTNPDRASPRAGGVTVTSPGALAHDHVDKGGAVRFYGKPHLPIFRAVEAAIDVPPDRLLMIGDSLEHDIAGGFGAGWATAFIRGGLHAAQFADADPTAALADLARAEGAPMPTYSLHQLG